MSERRNKIVQWMLNQGSGIVDAPETCFLKETTEKEQAEHPFGSVRYVYSMVVNLFENEIPFPEQVDYAVETDMDMLDFDEWQGIQEILFGEDSNRAMKPECAELVVPKNINDDRIPLHEPSCGSGGMVVATAQVLQKRGINYQKTLDVVCQDLDWSAVYMCYVQLSLLGIKAIVVQGDTLAESYKKGYPKERVFYTPAKRGLLI